MRTSRLQAFAAFATVVSLGVAGLGGPAGAADTTTTTTTGSSTEKGARGIAADTSFTAIAGAVRTPPQPVKASDGKYWFAYELVLTSMVKFELDVTSIDVRDAETESTIATFSGADLEAAMRPIASAGVEEVEKPTSLEPQTSAVVWMDFAVDTKEDIPKAIDHQVDMTPVNAPPAAPKNLNADLKDVRVDRRPPIVLGSPLAPGTWMVNDACCVNYTHHRRGFVALNGEPVVPQRYAIDFYSVDAEHRTWVGDPTVLTSYLSYDKAVISAAAGTVVASFDGLPDQAPPGPPPIPPIGDTVGNHVIVKVRPGIFLLYAHMKPGSVLVKKGQTLKKGQQIGSVGTSGNSSTPHLHFQVLTERTFFPSDSAPFRFAKFGLVGQLVVTPGVERIWDDNMGNQPDGVLPYKEAADPGPRRRVMPLDRDIITFGK